MKQFFILCLLTTCAHARIGQTSTGKKLILPNPFRQKSISYGKAGLPLSHKKIERELARLQENLALQRYAVAQGFASWQEAIQLHKRTKQIAQQIKKLPTAQPNIVQQLDATVAELQDKISELRYAGLNRDKITTYSNELDQLVPQLRTTFNTIISSFAKASADRSSS